MKKIAVLLGILSVFLFAPGAFANLVSVGDIISWTGEGGALRGGEMTIINKTTGATFKTFCLEAHRNISGNDFRVDDISSYVRSGGSPADGQTSEPLAGGTKWLFYNWAMGTLPGYVKTDLTTHGQDALQLAIWYLQGDLVTAQSGTYSGWDFVALANLHATEGLLLPVYAVNPVSLGGEDAQSFLVTPEPLTILLLGAGLIGLAGLRRKEQG